MKTLFLILGAQRSGTSVTSHLLSKLGVDFGNPAHFIQAEHNPIFFELDWLNDCNNQLIEALGYRYTDFFLPVEDDFAAIDTSTIEQTLCTAIEREWGEARCIGLKDPRLCLTFPVWEKIWSAYQLQIVLVFRHPAAFLNSNNRLLQNWKNWDDARHLNFWLQLNLAAVYFTRHFPVHYVNYDQLIKHPWTVAAELAEVFQLDRQRLADAVAVVDRHHYHHAAFSETGFPFVDHCYRLLCAHQLTAATYLAYRRKLLAANSSAASLTESVIAPD